MFSIIPHPTIPVETENRRILTPLPVPESVSILEDLRTLEPQALANQAPVIWNRADGEHVFDPWGNMWLDWGAGVMTANAGHGTDNVARAISEVARLPLLHAYVYPTRQRWEFLRLLTSLTGFPQAVLATTGSEAIEIAIKIARVHGLDSGRSTIVSFKNSFHGRTMAAQRAGGSQFARRWIGVDQADFRQMQYPSSEAIKAGLDLEEQLRLLEAEKAGVAAVLIEAYQGRTLEALDPKAACRISNWCQEQGALLIVDEMQSGFGRTGLLFGYQHFEITPDLVCCGKGIGNGLPLAAVLCDPALTQGFGAGELSSTHSGNVVSLVAGTESIKIHSTGHLADNAAGRGKTLNDGLAYLAKRHQGKVTHRQGLGLVGGLLAHPDRRPSFAVQIVEECYRRGLLLLPPVGLNSDLIKIAPPLTTTDAQIDEGLAVIGDILLALGP